MSLLLLFDGVPIEGLGLLLREVPPLRLQIEAETPSGRFYRWAEDEPSANNIPSGVRFSDVVPGGFESLDATLPRKPGIDYSDLERLTTLRARGAGGEIAWEGRLERTPRTSGDQMAISPSAVGWQAALEDNKSATALIVDRDLGNWQGQSVARKAALATSFALGDFSSTPDESTGLPGLVAETEGLLNDPLMEGWYDGGIGNEVASVHIKPTLMAFGLPDANLSHSITSASDDIATGFSYQDLKASNGARTTINLTTARRWASILLSWTGTGGGSVGTTYGAREQEVAVFGNHGLTKRGTAPNQGFYASDVIPYLLRKFCPTLSFTEGAEGTIKPSDFVLLQFAFREPTTVAEMIRHANRVHLRDWAVWEGPAFHYHQRGAGGRTWRLRTGPTQFEETGPQVDRLWESVVVQFPDVDGSTRTVGPPGSGADVETADLKDDDPLNPANQLGITRRDLLVMSDVSTTGVATQVGVRFLEESKLLDSSGRAQVVGYAEDDKGVRHPYHRMRAGDRAVFVNAADTSERRIVKTDKDHPTRTCSIDIDAPPEGLSALLERLGAILVRTPPQRKGSWVEF